MLKIIIVDSYWKRGDYELEFSLIISDDKLYDVEYYNNLYYFIEDKMTHYSLTYMNEGKFIFTWKIFKKITDSIELGGLCDDLSHFDDNCSKDDYLYPVNMRIRMMTPTIFD